MSCCSIQPWYNHHSVKACALSWAEQSRVHRRRQTLNCVTSSLLQKSHCSWHTQCAPCQRQPLPWWNHPGDIAAFELFYCSNHIHIIPQYVSPFSLLLLNLFALLLMFWLAWDLHRYWRWFAKILRWLNGNERLERPFGFLCGRRSCQCSRLASAPSSCIEKQPKVSIKVWGLSTYLH